MRYVISGLVPDSQCLVGSRTRFDALYREHCGAVPAFVHRRVASAAADDVVSEVFVVAIV
jgi:DNA-directed RNA polymerase specialized sigma24 family protein